MGKRKENEDEPSVKRPQNSLYANASVSYCLSKVVSTPSTKMPGEKRAEKRIRARRKEERKGKRREETKYAPHKAASLPQYPSRQSSSSPPKTG